jgi:hypothetical protein
VRLVEGVEKREGLAAPLALPPPPLLPLALLLPPVVGLLVALAVLSSPPVVPVGERERVTEGEGEAEA